jgi:hypothetical protein
VWEDKNKKAKQKIEPEEKEEKEEKEKKNETLLQINNSPGELQNTLH